MSHATEFFFLSSILAWHLSPSSPISTRWCLAPPPYVTINIDGSLKGNSRMFGAGGVARSTIGEWLWGFSLYLGFTNNTMVELWGIREALLWAWDNGHRWVFFQTNSLLATKWLNTNVVYSMEFSNLILDCRWLLNRDWEAHVKHMWREANSCADLLAERGASQSEREILYDTCPAFSWQCLYWDSMGFVSSRSCRGQ